MRTLRKEEINVKPKQVINGKILLLLYKDARVDMDMLDEEFGSMNWKRSHKEVAGNLFCTIEVWNKDTSQWVAKEDVGIESNMEKEKGEASDAFKRAGFNWGIGRELYTAPQIWVVLSQEEKAKDKVYTKFHVSRIEYDADGISLLEISDNSRARFQWVKGQKAEEKERYIKDDIRQALVSADIDKDWKEKVLSQFDRYDDSALERLLKAIPQKEKEYLNNVANKGWDK